MVILAVIGLVSLAVALSCAVTRGLDSNGEWKGFHRRSDLRDVRRERANVEGAIDKDHSDARRAMNDAANQSWRNLVD